MSEADSHAKVGMRKKVRGLRTIERQLLAEQRVTEAAAQTTALSPRESTGGSRARGVGHAGSHSRKQRDS